MHNNHNIIGYLQKKNFFNRSPSPTLSPNSRFSNYISNKTPQKSPIKQKTPVRSKNSQADLNLSKSPFHQRVKTRNQLKRQPQTIFKTEATQKKYQSGFRKFDSSRVEMKMCLEDLSRRVSSELRMLESTLTEITLYFQNMFQKRLAHLKKKLMESVETIFSQTKNNLQKEIIQSEYFQFEKAEQTKINLAQADEKLKVLKVQMDTNWKKVAGQIFMDEFDDKIEVVLKESQKTRKQLSHKMMKAENRQEDQSWLLMKKGIDMLLKAKFIEAF